MSAARADGVRAAHPLFQAGGSGAKPTSALSLTVFTIDFKDARAMNRLWHSRLPAITNPTSVMGVYPHFGAEFEGVWYAVAIWSNPVARLLPQDGTWLELRRMAVAPDAPRNTASRMLAVMARLIRKSRATVTTLVSYQDTEVHTGGIYRAAGWKPVTLDDPRSRPWNNAARVRNEAQSASPKQRWERRL